MRTRDARQIREAMAIGDRMARETLAPKDAVPSFLFRYAGLPERLRSAWEHGAVRAQTSRHTEQIRAEFDTYSRGAVAAFEQRLARLKRVREAHNEAAKREAGQVNAWQATAAEMYRPRS